MKVQTQLIVSLSAITFIIGIAGSFAIYQVNRIPQPLGRLSDNIEELDRASRLDTLAQLIRYYDEVLGQSMRNYAFTQDRAWEQRYRQAEPELDTIIKEAISLGDETDKQFFSSIDRANVNVVEMEYRAIDLIREGQSSEAIAILESPQYREQKAIYARGITDYVERREELHEDALRVSTDTLQAATDDAAGVVADTTRTIVIVIPVILVATALSGFFIFYSINKPMTALRHAAAEIARGNFDVEIDKSRDDEIGELALRLDVMREELKRKDTLKDEFISIASHELKSPIQPILGYIDLAKKGYIRHEQAIDGILPQVRRLQQLTNDILDVSRIDSGSLALHMEKVRMGDVIADVVGATRAYLGGGVLIEMDLDKETESIKIDADKSRITQVLSNIVGNAAKFTKEGVIRVESRTSPERNSVTVTVSDSGGGIPADILPNLFGKFVTKSVGKDNQHGTGLGLFISKAIMVAHGGTIQASNNDRGGATFVVTLPVSQDEKMH